MWDGLVGLLLRFVVGVVVGPPADFDSLRGEPLRRLRASLRERALRATSPFRGGTAQEPPSAVGRDGRGQVGFLLVRCIYHLGYREGRER